MVSGRDNCCAATGVVMSEEKTIADLKPDPTNARKHSARNIGMIVDSLQKVGAARSIVIDEDDVILAGNGVIEAAAEAGIEQVRIVEADGNEIIAVRRSGLTDEQKAKLALWDNRAAELAEWDQQALGELAEKQDLSDLFTEAEWDRVTRTIEQNETTLLDQAVQLKPPREYIVVMCENEVEWVDLKVALELKPVRRGGYKLGSPLDSAGTERVVRAAELLIRLGYADSDTE